MKHLLMAAAALIVMAAPAMAKDVTKAAVLSLESGGLQGGVGCLYVTTDSNLAPGGVFTLPLNASPNTPQIVAANNISTHNSVSFNLGAANAVCTEAPAAPTILLPSTP